jgi:metallophosphoesterase (TIGR00282 family)
LRILFIGDIVGKKGRRTVKEVIYKVIEEYRVDLCLANGENAAGGFGITPTVAEELFDQPIEVLTSGNHIWDRKEIIDYIEKEECLLRPANYPQESPGKGSTIFTTAGGLKVGILNLEGRVFVSNIECPFKTATREINSLKKQTSIIFVDFHAEATSEKMAMGWFLDGKASAVVGTHTHVQTADERILPGGTAYITDVGMTGPRDSVIGIKKEQVLDRFITNVPQRFECASGQGVFCAVIIDVDENTGLAKTIERLSLLP